jgi:hypothetical protein
MFAEQLRTESPRLNQYYSTIICNPGVEAFIAVDIVHGIQELLLTVRTSLPTPNCSIWKFSLDDANVEQHVCFT